MSFTPPHCPNQKCHSNSGHPFLWRKRGSYPRKCDGRRVQRFHCIICQKGFSTQSFRLDYRLKLLRIQSQVFKLFCSKVTQRQSARIVEVDRKTIAHRLLLLSTHCRDFHQQQLLRVKQDGGLGNVIFQLDEMESFEGDRRICPVTIPVLIERNSYFVIHAESADLPARGHLTPFHKARKISYETLHGKRRSGSRKAVKNTLEKLNSFAFGIIDIQSDRKRTYKSLARQLFGDRLGMHHAISSADPRIPGSILFPINQTLAMLRDGVSRLVRRSWGNAKKRFSIDRHLWIWMAWRNYVRGITVVNTEETPAMVVGVSEKQWKVADFLRWRVFPASFFGQSNPTNWARVR